MAWLLILLCWLPALALAELKPFGGDSLAQIAAEREGRPFLLMLWSLDCPPCLQEMAGLGDQLAAGDAEAIVLISTDGPGSRAEVERTLRGFGLDGLDNWLFADDFVERLRFRIDPNWFGELPRSYFYNADHQRRARSGVLTPEQLRGWLRQARSPGASS